MVTKRFATSDGGSSKRRKKVDEDALKETLLEELEQTDPDWGGTAVEIGRYEDPVNSSLKELVQAEGADHGCHTCLEIVSLDTDQPWIGDHIPPTQLSSASLRALGYATPPKPARRLYAQCDRCAEKQSILVKRLNILAGKALEKEIATLSPKQMAMLKGGVGHKNVPSHGPRVSEAEGKHVQSIGVRDGCHCCGRPYPKRKYHADHCPPVLLHMPSAQKIMQAVGIPAPTAYYAKPQCPRCSHGQGGALSSLKVTLSKMADELGMPNYWNS